VPKTDQEVIKKNSIEQIRNKRINDIEEKMQRILGKIIKGQKEKENPSREKIKLTEQGMSIKG